MWLDFVELQLLYPEGGDVRTVQLEPKEDLGEEHDISVANMHASLISHLGSS